MADDTSRRGRPSKCTDAVIEEICKLLSEGHTITNASAALRISLPTFWRWTSRADRALERFEVDGTPIPASEAIYVKFRIETTHARAEGERKLEQHILDAARTDASYAMRYLQCAPGTSWNTRERELNEKVEQLERILARVKMGGDLGSLDPEQARVLAQMIANDERIAEAFDLVTATVAEIRQVEGGGEDEGRYTHGI